MKKFEILKLLARIEKRSNCAKRKVGAFLCKPNGIIDQGYNYIDSLIDYNYSPSYSELCENICKKCLSSSNFNKETCPAIHAEIMLLTHIHQWITDEDIIVVSYTPCINCCKAIAEARPGAVIVKEPKLKELEVEMQEAYGVKTYDDLAEMLITEGTKYRTKYIRLWEYDISHEVIPYKYGIKYEEL